MVAQTVKNPPAMQKTQVLSLGREDPLEEAGLGNPLQCSCLENPMDRGYWRAVVYRVTKTRTGLKRLSLHHTRFLAALTVSLLLWSVGYFDDMRGFAVERAGGVQLVFRAAFLDLKTLSESCERAMEILLWKFDRELGALYLILVGSW